MPDTDRTVAEVQAIPPPTVSMLSDLLIVALGAAWAWYQWEAIRYAPRAPNSMRPWIYIRSAAGIAMLACIGGEAATDGAESPFRAGASVAMILFAVAAIVAIAKQRKATSSTCNVDIASSQ